MSAITEVDLQQLFTEARGSYSAWLDKPVPDESLHAIYDLMKWAPTSANLSPARVLFIKNGPEKAKFLEVVAPFNVDKVKSAPVTAVIAQDEKFYDHITTLFPMAPHFREMFANNAELSAVTAMRNSSLQGGYFIMAARALGFDCNPMSGFDNAKLDAAFFAGTSWRSNFICNLGYGDKSKLMPRLPRLPFDVACKIV
jgi:3-hydroxypropanoate dehydrogenase